MRRREGSRAQRAWRIVGWTLLGLVGLIIVIVSSALVVINTERGARWVTGLANQRVQEMIPGLHIGGIDGFLPFSFTLEDVSLVDGRGQPVAFVEEVYVDVALWPILRRTIRIEALEVRSPVIQLARRADGTLNVADVEIDLPPPRFEIVVDDLRLVNGSVFVKLEEVRRAALQQLGLAGSLHHDGRKGRSRLVLNRFRTEYRVDGRSGLVAGSARAQVTPDEIDARLSTRLATRPGGEDVRLTATVLGPRQDLDVDLEVRGPGGLRVEGEADVDLPARAYQARLMLDAQAARLRARAQGTGGAFSLVVRGKAERLGPLRLGEKSLSADGDLDLSAERQADGRLQAQGTFGLDRLRYGDDVLKGLKARLEARFSPEPRRGRLIFETVGPYAVNGVRLAVTRLAAVVRDDVLSLDGRVAPAAARGGALAPLTFAARLPLADEGMQLATGAPLSARLVWRGVSLARLARLAGQKAPIAGQLRLFAAAKGTLAEPEVDGTVRLGNVRYGKASGFSARMDLGVDEAAVRLELAARRRGKLLVQGFVQAGAGPAALVAPNALREVPIEAVFRVPPLAAKHLAGLAPALAGVDAKLSARLRLDGTATDPRLRLAVALAPERGDDRLEALVRARVNDTRTVARLGASLGGQPVLTSTVVVETTPADYLAGEPPERVSMRASGELGPLALARLTRLLPSLPPVEGRLSGRYSLTGTVRDPLGEVSLRGRDLRLSGEALGDLKMVASLKPRRAAVDLVLAQREGGLELAASLGGGGDAELQLALRSLDLGGLRKWRPSLPLADDTGSATVEARGTVGVKGAAGPVARLRDPGVVRGSVTVEGLWLATYLNRPGGKQKKTDLEPERIAETLKKGIDFHLKRFSVRDSHIRLIDGTAASWPGLDFADLAVTVENLASDRSLMGRVPVVLTARAKVEKAADLVIFATVDPLAEQPVAAGRAVLTNLPLTAVNELLAPYEVKATEGSFSCYVSFRVRNGEITGGIKPIVPNLELEPTRSASWAKAALIEIGDFFAGLLKDDIKGREALAAVIPIKGRLEAPTAQLVPAVLTVIRNAFVVGLARGFANLPPETAGEDQSIFTQAAEALTPEDFPKAQPTNGEK